MHSYISIYSRTQMCTHRCADQWNEILLESMDVMTNDYSADFGSSISVTVVHKVKANKSVKISQNLTKYRPYLQVLPLNAAILHNSRKI